jgi:hypothetical protein
MLVLVAAPMLAIGQSYGIDWFTIESGGGISSGGAYQLAGTIGQTDAGSLVEGNYVLDGGFWAHPFVLELTQIPSVTIALNGSQVVLAWPVVSAGFVLESVSSLRPPIVWELVSASVEVSAGMNLVRVPALEAARYYRLKR